MSLHYSFLQFQKQLRRFDEEKEADSNGQSDKLDKNEVDDEFFEKEDEEVEATDSDVQSDEFADSEEEVEETADSDGEAADSLDSFPKKKVVLFQCAFCAFFFKIYL